jgi:hypothetical protein
MNPDTNKFENLYTDFSSQELKDLEVLTPKTILPSLLG